MRPALFFFRCVEAILRAMHQLIRSTALCRIGILELLSAELVGHNVCAQRLDRCTELAAAKLSAMAL